MTFACMLQTDTMCAPFSRANTIIIQMGEDEIHAALTGPEAN